MSRPRLSEIAGWLGLVAALVIIFRQGAIEGSWPVVSITAVLVATAVLVFWRAWTGLSRLQTLLIEGRPRPMLRILRGKLRYRAGGRDRGPLLIYKAAALSMDGQFEAGLAALDELDVGDLPTDDRPSWEFAYHTTRFSCLLFAERIAEARDTFSSEIEPRAQSSSAVAIRAMAAQLDYCEGEHIRAERTFEEIISDDRTPPASRGVFHYFLGRIYFDRNQESKANEQFGQARTLAAKTWIPAGIDAVLREATREASSSP